ncbi:hypothetical protein [Fischerella sp. JS2]|nr:hypothetical protein [Fischerella sp. JS2]
MAKLVKLISFGLPYSTYADAIAENLLAAHLGKRMIQRYNTTQTLKC